MPLTKKQLEDMKESIERAEVNLKDALADITQAKRAGIDVSEQEKSAQVLREQIRKLRAVYV